MRVGINARTFSVDQPGGAVQASIRHTRGLIDRSDTEVIIFGHRSLSSQFPDATVISSGYPTSSQSYGLLWERSLLPRLATKHNVDVLYCPNGNAPITRTSVPVVLCIHDVNALKGWSSGAHQIYRKLAVPRAAAISNIIITVSEFSKEEIVSQLDVPPSKVEVVPNGIDPLFFSGEAERLNILPEQYLLFVGSMNPRKNISRVIKSYIKMKSNTNLEHKLVIIGPDNKPIFKSINIEDRDDILTLGFVSKQELKYAYENADIFVFPSLYEGFGLPPLEALACGTPVVISETTALGEVIQKGCIHVDPTDVDEIASAVLKILENEEVRENLKTNGRNFARRFSCNHVTKKLYSVLSKTV